MPTVTLLATVTLFCLTEGLAWDVGTGSLNSTHLFSLLSLRSLQREGNDGQGSNPRPHGPQPPCWDKEEELQTGCPRGPTRPCGRKKMQVISGWMDRRHMPGVGGRSWASRSFSVCPKVLRVNDGVCPTHPRWDDHLCQASVGVASRSLCPSPFLPVTGIAKTPLRGRLGYWGVLL